ncbi:hypothetical protein GOBAR_DD06431 [Gossypium barbadense]|nr:hypothetical protein GOBAR_DD06431 [Gossypium barbadense]
MDGSGAQYAVMLGSMTGSGDGLFTMVPQSNPWTGVAFGPSVGSSDARIFGHLAGIRAGLGAGHLAGLGAGHVAGRRVGFSAGHLAGSGTRPRPLVGLYNSVNPSTPGGLCSWA